MFTGIVTDIGTVESVEGGASLKRLRIACSYDPATIAIGASIACAGCCLTAIAVGGENGRELVRGGGGGGDASPHPCRHVAGGHAHQSRTRLKIGDELGGHIVTGHVDALAEIVSRDEVTPSDANWGATARFTLRAPKPLHRFIAAKGSVCLDGVSLTVNTVEDDLFSVLLIPHTLAVTTFGARKAGRACISRST